MKLRTLLIASALVFLVSCGKEDAPTPPVDTGSDTPSSLSVSIRDFKEGDAVIDYIVDSDSEYSRSVLLTVSEDVSAIRYYILNTDFESDDTWSYMEEETLATVDALAAGESLAVQLEMPEILPNRGIAMLDKNGAEHRFFFHESGEDGSALLTEYTENN